MKPYLSLNILSLLVISLFLGCSKNNEDNFIISGNIESYTNNPDRELRLCSLRDSLLSEYNPSIFGFSGIKSDGYFKMTAISAPDEKLLVPLDSIFGINIVKSDNSVKACRGILNVFNNKYQDYIGGLSKQNTEVLYAPGGISVKFIYVDNDVNISGTGIRIKENPFLHYHTTYLMNCNLSLKAGWNQYIDESISIQPTQTNDLYSIEPEGLKWYFSQY